MVPDCDFVRAAFRRLMFLVASVIVALVSTGTKAADCRDAACRHRIGLSVGVMVAGRAKTMLEEDYWVPLTGNPGSSLSYTYYVGPKTGLGLSVGRWWAVRTNGKETGGFLDKYSFHLDAVLYGRGLVELVLRPSLFCTVWWIDEDIEPLRWNSPRSYHYHGVGPGFDANLIVRLWHRTWALSAALGGGFDRGEGEEWIAGYGIGTHLVYAAWIRLGLEVGLGRED